MARRDTSASVRFISDQAGLDSFVSVLAEADRVGIDTEADSLHHYFEKVCLIQLGLPAGEPVLVDPLAQMDLSGFLAVLATKPLVFHGADYDLRMLRLSYGFEPGAPVFDTMLAAQLVGLEQIGLAAVVERFFEVALPKQNQKADWSRRPLPEKMLAYAADDSRYLLRLAQLMEEQLESLGRLEWHRQWCEDVVATSQNSSPAKRDDDDAWRIKGSSALKGLELAVLREIWHWRDGIARRADRPPFMVMANRLMIDIARWAAQHDDTDALEKGIRLPRNVTGRRLASLRRALEKARQLPRPKWPGPPMKRARAHRRPEPIDKGLLSRVQKTRDAIAEHLQLPPSVIAPRAAVTAIARHRPGNAEEIRNCASLLPWQAELLADQVARLVRSDGRETSPETG